MNQTIRTDYSKNDMIKRLTIVILLCATGMTLSAKMSRVDSLSQRMQILECQMVEEQKEIANIQKGLGFYEKEMSAICEHVDRANEAVSNQIAVSSHTIQVWGWIIAIMAFVFGFYINRMWKKISVATTNAKEQLQQAKEASADITEEQQRVNVQQQEVKKIQEDAAKKLQELQNLNSDIQNNMSAIYEKMKREETIALLKRLEEIPEDVATLQGMLLVRPLRDEDFDVLLRAYRKLVNSNLDLYEVSTIEELRLKSSKFIFKEETFLVLFAQHFMGKAIVIPELRSLLCSHFDALLKDYFFKNDAEKSTADFKKGVSALESQLQVDLIKDYISAMSQSQYAKFTEWYKILLSDLAENQLKDIWEGVTNDNVNAIFFAQTIKEVLISINPQSPVIAEISAYIKNIEQQNLSQDLEAT